MSSTQQDNSTGRSVDIDSMSLEQLNQLKTSEESRLQVITNHYATLRASSARFQASKDALSAINPSSEGKDIMSPLTESLYVPGMIKEPSKVMVELGTGYYAEKSVKDAIAFLDRKNKLVSANSDNIMEVITVTRRNIESITVAMQGKMMEIRAKQEGRRVMMEAQQS